MTPTNLPDYMTYALACIGGAWLIHAIAATLCDLITTAKDNRGNG